MNREQIFLEQAKCLALSKQGKSREEICQLLNLNMHQVKRRITGAKKAARLDPAILNSLQNKGFTDLAGLHTGWIMDKDKDGTGHSLYFHLGPDEEKIDFVEALMESMRDIPRLPLLPGPNRDQLLGRNTATWLMVADLHVGADYGTESIEQRFNMALDDLVARLPPAEKAVLIELGDLLDANDHKGVTPASGNPCDVRRDNHLQNTMAAVRLMRRAAYRLLETHEEVELHLIPGNHDPTAYMAVLLALAEHFADNPRITVIVPQTPMEEDFRVITWGQSAVMPNHGEKATWVQLKDVWTELFADEWADAKAYRLIATAHLHHDRRKELTGCFGEHYRTLQNPNRWARTKGLVSRGALTALTVHKDRGEENRVTHNIKFDLKGLVT